MPFFVEDRLYEPLLPKRYLEVLRKLDRFEQLCDELRSHPPQSSADERAQRVDARYRELLALTEEQLPPGPDLVTAGTGQRAFAAGVMLLFHYEQTVLSDVPIVDTLGSKTLLAFKTDLQCTKPATRERLRNALSAAFNLSPADIAAIDANLARELEALRLRHELILALNELHPLSPDDPLVRDKAFALFAALHPEHPFRPGDVDVIRTGTTIFFCIPYTGTELDRPDFAERPPSEQEAVRSFIRHLSTLQQEYFGHFPVFGPYRGERSSPALLSALAARTGRAVEDVAAALTTTVTTLRGNEIDKYIVHDTWGHQWQAHLFEFEEHYREVAACREPPRLDAAFSDVDGSQVTLRGVLDAARARLLAGEELTAADLDRYLRPAIRTHLIHALTGLITEALADVIEYKFLVLAPEAAADLESSSFLKHWPTKLDLTLIDLPFFFRMAVKGLRDLSEDAELRAGLAKRYAEAAGSEARVAEVVDAFCRRIDELLDTLFAPKFIYEPSDAGIKVNVFARMALNLLGLNTTLNRVYQRLAEAQLDYVDPLDDFRDLLVLSTAAFFEDDPIGHFWHMDEFLGIHFEPCLRTLLETLRDTPA